MNSVAIRLYRLVLLAYPAQFRRDFAAEMVRLLADRHDHEAGSEWRVLLDEIVDAADVAPSMRWESPMSRIALLTVAGTAAIAATLVAQLALIAWGRPLQPIVPAPASRRWVTWLLTGGAAIATAIAIPAIDRGELNAVWWTVMMLTMLGGIAPFVSRRLAMG